uniref:B box-type domain-containing protein n=1 Tax=Sander lucioperca TaxID=283035 RepID=A0A8C9YQ67_SANLU
MASRLEEDLCCPVCYEVFMKCPACKRSSSMRQPPSNVALKNLCESFLQERDQRASEAFCSLHSEELKIFSLDHQQAVFVICRDSEKHTNHTIRPIDEAAQKRKTLQKTLEHSKEKLKAFERVQVKCDQTADHMKVQARRKEMQIKEQYQMLHKFLEEEEEARMAALWEEVEQKSQWMKEKNREIAALSDTVRAIEEQLRAEAVSFLTQPVYPLQTVIHSVLVCSVTGRLQRIIRSAEKVIGCNLPPLQDLYATRTLKRAGKIVADPSHPGHKLFQPLPAGIRTKISRHKDAFPPSATSLINTRTAMTVILTVLKCICVITLLKKKYNPAAA